VSALFISKGHIGFIHKEQGKHISFRLRMKHTGRNKRRSEHIILKQHGEDKYWLQAYDKNIKNNEKHLIKKYIYISFM
jgi:hypothetical protein